jgi:hypothetical protein
MNWSGRRHQKAIERQNNGYSAAMNAVTVDDAAWASQFDAAATLGISLWKIGILIAGRQLVAAHNESGQAGLTRDSVEREATRRDDAGPLRRASLYLTDYAKALLHSV